MKSKRVILDTNIWISFLISNNFRELDFLIEKEKIILIFSTELLEEFLEVVSRPKFSKLFSYDDIQNLLNIFDQYAELVQVTSVVDYCRDAKDNFLLNLSLDAKADFLVTGDKDLLELKIIDKTKIIVYSEFIKKLNSY